jgi:hypothetical protein
MAMKGKLETFATAATRCASARRPQEFQAFVASVITTIAAIAAMTDLSSALADSRSSMLPPTGVRPGTTFLAFLQ